MTAGREIVGHADLAEIVPRLRGAAAHRIEGQAAHQRGDRARTQTADEDVVLDVAVEDAEREVRLQVFQDIVVQTRVDEEIIDLVLALDARQHGHGVGDVHHGVDPRIFGQDGPAVVNLVDSGQRGVGIGRQQRVGLGRKALLLELHLQEIEGDRSESAEFLAEIDIGIAVGVELVPRGSIDHAVALLVTGSNQILNHSVAAAHFEHVVRYERGRIDLFLPVGVETVAHLLSGGHVAAQERERLADLPGIRIVAAGDIGDVTAEVESRKQGQRLVNEPHALDALQFDQRPADLTALGLDHQHAVAAERAVRHCVGALQESDLLDIAQADRFEQVARKTVDDIRRILVRQERNPVNDQQRRILSQQRAVAAQVEEGALPHHAALVAYAKTREAAREGVARRKITAVDVLDAHRSGRTDAVRHRDFAVGRGVMVGRQRVGRLLEVDHHAVPAEQVDAGRKIALFHHVESRPVGEDLGPENTFRTADDRTRQFVGADLRRAERLPGVGIQHETHDLTGRLPIPVLLRRCSSPGKEYGQ